MTLRVTKDVADIVNVCCSFDGSPLVRANAMLREIESRHGDPEAQQMIGLWRGFVDV